MMSPYNKNQVRENEWKKQTLRKGLEKARVGRKSEVRSKT